MLSLLLALAFLLPATAFAQEQLALSADRVEFSDGFSVIEATGNVALNGQGRILKAERISFDKTSGIVTVEGPLTFASGDKFVVLADFAELSSDLRDGVIRDSRLLLDSRMQFTAAELSKEKENLRLLNAYGTPCAICRPGETPTWSIQAEEVETDADGERVVFRNAILRILGVPVAFVPWISIPGPSVDRADGLLPPKIFQTDAIGGGIALPYYQTLGDHADATLIPFVTERGGSGIEFENRIVSSAGKLDFSGSIASGGEREGYRTWLSAEGKWRLSDSLTFSHNNESVSDNLFLREFAYSQKNRIENSFSLERLGQGSRLQTDVIHFRSLTDIVANRTIPNLVGRTFLNFRFDQLPVGGLAELELSATALERKEGTDRLSAGAKFGWSRSWVAAGSIEFTSEIAGTAAAYSYGGKSSGSQYQAIPSAGFKLRWPWIKRESAVFETITPTAQLVWSPDSDKIIVDEDSNLMEVDEANLFLVNRFSGYDRLESGTRLNLGIAYNRSSQEGSNLELFLGRILRSNFEDGYSAASGLNGRNSDFIVSANLKTSDNLKLNSRILISDTLDVARADSGAEMTLGKLTISGGHAWFATDAGSSNSRFAEFYILDGLYSLSSSWSARANWRYDGAANAPIREEIGVSYRRDCASVDLALSRHYQSSFDISPITSLKLNFQLGLGGGRKNSATPTCS